MATEDVHLRVPFATLLKVALFALLVIAIYRLWTVMTHGAIVGLEALEATMALIFTLVLTIYFLVEGDVVLIWLTSFAPASQRRKWSETASELGDVILAYMRGQAITCCLCGGWAFLVLTVLRVPAALPLAVLAFFCDLVPVVGTIVMTVPAVLLAMTVGPLAALLVLAGYVFYHLVESYIIIPRVYGHEMRLSTLTVLLAVAVGGKLMGPIGAVLILPFVAAYPIVERIWLRRHLPADTVPRHEALVEE